LHIGQQLVEHVSVVPFCRVMSSYFAWQVPTIMIPLRFFHVNSDMSPLFFVVRNCLFFFPTARRGLLFPRSLVCDGIFKDDFSEALRTILLALD